MLMAEYTSNPLALKRRLGLAFVTGSQKRRSGGQDLGELAVRTAVRATVWEAFEQFFVFFASGSADDRKSLGNLDAVSDACYHPW